MRSTASRHDGEPGPFTLRGWLVVTGGVATAAIILGAWLPVGALLGQREQLSAADARLTQLAAEGRTVAAATQRLSSPVALEQLAREEYQLVLPGQHLVLVETPSTAPGATNAGALPWDPGFAPLVDPSAASQAVGSGGTDTATGTAPGHPAATPGSPGFLSRVLGTLEFWR